MRLKTETMIHSIRLPFLILSPVCIFLGYSIACNNTNEINQVNLVLILLGAIAAHVSVNTLNEYFDYKSGLDSTTIKTPFSGGSGALIENPAHANAVLLMALISLCITMLVGIYFVLFAGLLVLPIGIAGVVLIVTYTTWLNKFPFICLVAPGLAFGPLMVVGSSYVLVGDYTAQMLVISLVPFFLVNNLLLLNQFPDIEADKRVGRRHIPIVYGVKASTGVYAVFIFATLLTIVYAVSYSLLPVVAYTCLLPLSISWVVLYGMVKHGNRIEKLIPYMGGNVASVLLTPLFLSIAILLAGR